MPDTQISEEMVEAGCIGMYGKNWNGPPEKRPGEDMKNVWRKYARDCISAALFGYIIVPREPTEAMLDAGGWAIAERNGDMSSETEALAQVAYAGWGG